MRCIRSRASRFVACLALFTCLVCPILETFDYWDHTIQTGADTEYIFVVIALCVGAVHAFARLAIALPFAKAVSEAIFRQGSLRPPAEGGIGPFFITPIPLSPPVLTLRI